MEDHHHKDLIGSVAAEYSDILRNSEQGVYIYLSDDHKVCNKKFTTLLGYNSPEEWAKIEESFPDVFVAEESQDTLITSFQDAMETMTASRNKIAWKKKDGSTIQTTVILAPIVHNGHLLALHFVSERN